MAETGASARPAASRVLVPLASAQFICSFAGAMNVMINDTSKDLNTTGRGMPTAVTVFLVVMAALMTPATAGADRHRAADAPGEDVGSGRGTRRPLGGGPA